jgi:serine protease inhibitor
VRHLIHARNVGFAIGILLASIVTGCGGGGGSAMSPNSPSNGSAPPAVLQAKDANTAVDPAIVTADNAFGMNLFQSLNSGAVDNVVISPISVAISLQVLYNGAAGSTQSAMAQALQLGALSTQDMNNDNAALQASLLNPDPKVQIIVANSLWIHPASTAVLPAFTSADQMYYGATVGDLAGAPADVNTWAANETNGLITSILPAGNYASAVAVIANTIYFKGEWTTAFDPAQTVSQPFTLDSGMQIPVEMMNQTGNFAYLQGNNFQAVRLPYGQGRFSMLIVLPNAGTNLDSLLAGITADSVNGWIAQTQSAYGSIALPRFTSTYTASLAPALSTLGMGIALCSSKAADFSLLAPGACVSSVQHKTVVEVDENGTVAASGTGVTVGVTAIAAPNFTMSMDHPFFYAIRDDQSGELLFVGTLLDPSS